MLFIQLFVVAIGCGFVSSCRAPLWIWPSGTAVDGDDYFCDGKKGYPCSIGQGDCNVHDDCEGDLVCGTNNCVAFWMSPSYPKFEFTDDCCEENTTANGWN
eukprot:GFUD01110803.1.p1 GENE.GFUD01110803.1~~GFUD01110803.1.p1  ORF type:complete len:101 (-),score=13.16 GFUD01110803.1:117-419(-)